MSIFEALASGDPITQEISKLLAKSIDTIESEKLQSDTGSVSDVGTEEEEVDIEDINHSSVESSNTVDEKVSKDENICFLVRVCLENISSKVC